MKLQGVWIALLVTLSAQAFTTFTLLCAGRPTMQVSLMDGGMITMGWPGQFTWGTKAGGGTWHQAISCNGFSYKTEMNYGETTREGATFCRMRGVAD